MAKTLLALIPFTKAYNEANEAMFELNDIEGMQVRMGEMHCTCTRRSHILF